jgi:pyruvate-ferredoxin/flavodoxin oxidoreductase
MQVAFFEVTGCCPTDEAHRGHRDAVRTTYAELGQRSSTATSTRSTGARRRCPRCPSRGGDRVACPCPTSIERALELRAPRRGDVPGFVERVTARILAGEGELLPVSALPVDGTFPTGTARWEKRSIAEEIPTWDPDLCIDCGKCAIVCPHAAIQIKVFEPRRPRRRARHFLSKPFKDRDLEGTC